MDLVFLGKKPTVLQQLNYSNLCTLLRGQAAEISFEQHSVSVRPTVVTACSLLSL